MSDGPIPSINGPLITTSNLLFSEDKPLHLSAVSIGDGDGVNDLTVVLYDGDSETGEFRWKYKVAAANEAGGRNWTSPLLFKSGRVYCVITTSGTASVVGERLLV